MSQLPIPKHILSKSTFMYGCQCPKRLWLHKFMPEEKDEEDEAQTAIFQTGTDVGKLAQQLFPGGVDATPVDYFSFQQSVADTAQYIAEGKTVIYEAAFQYDGILCAVDILVRKNKKWYAYEVKSTNSVKDTHIQDAALQYYVMVHSGIDLKDICIVHLNRDYIRYGELDIKQLFTPTTVLNNVLSLQESIEIKIDELRKVLKLKKMPAIEMGNQCDTPYPCNFQGFCSKDIVSEEPDYGEAYINNEAIEEFISELEYPLYFMDFETWMSAVPECDGHWPYRQVNFQYSVHLQESPDSPLKHYYYLAEGPHSPQKEFIDNLLSILGDEGSIVVYNKGFEKTRLKELVMEFPELEDEITAVQERMIDLMHPFRKNYRLPEMQGSYSIKYVLPALVPELSYAALSIGNGGDASAAFYNLKNEKDTNKVTEVRNALLEYCGLDTLAMVRILEKLKQL